MIISIKASSSNNFGNYLVDRDTNAYTIIEGDAKRIDNIATYLLEKYPEREITNYSFVLSFKEEHLTKDDLYTYYQDFKEKAFKNYNPDELEILSVIHWDDNKPHIHCNVIASSMIDERDLRLYRGFPDFSRFTAIRELINYKYNLESPLSDLNILSLTKSQKKRDRIARKGGRYYEVFDDFFKNNIENILKQPNVTNFENFILEINKKYGKLDITNAKESLNDTFMKSKVLKPNRLTLLNESNSFDKKEHYSYDSILFNKDWFNKNIVKLKKNLNTTSLDNIKYSRKRKSSKEYHNIYNQSTKKHNNHLIQRKVGKDYLKNTGINAKPDKLTTIFATQIRNKELFDYRLDKYVDSIKNDTKNFTPLIDYAKSKKFQVDISSGSIKLTKEDYEYIIEGAFNSPINNIKHLEDELEKELLSIKKNNSKKRIRLLIEELFYLKKIKSKKEFELYLQSLGLTVIKTAFDSNRGFNATLENNLGKITIYNDAIYSLCNIDKVDKKSYKKEKIEMIDSELKKKFTSNYVKSVYISMQQKEDLKHINTINDYRLDKSDDLIDQYFKIFNTNSEEKIHKFQYKNSNNISEVIKIGNDGTVRVLKSLNKHQTGMNLADLYAFNGFKGISLENITDDELKNGFIARVKEMNYPISVYNNLGDIEFSGFNKKKISEEELTKEVIKNMNESDEFNSLLALIEKIDNININTNEGVINFRNTLIELNGNYPDNYELILNTMGIEFIRSSKDKTKGDYTTYLYKDKKIAVYDTSISKKYSQSTSSEAILM
jgi:hypothetical protein